MFQTIGKYTALCGSTLLIAMAAATVHAADGQVEFTGSVNDNACTINSESVKKSVDMGQVRIADFPNTVGAVATSGATPFSISLENCSGSTLKNASIKFSGQQAMNDPTLLGMTGENQVTGIGIQISDVKSNIKLALNTASPDYELRPQGNTFDFKATYVRLVADTGGVSGIGTGKVNALASFDVTYK